VTFRFSTAVHCFGYILLLRPHLNNLYCMETLLPPCSVKMINVLVFFFLSFNSRGEMASPIQKKLAKHLECPVCLEKFTEPKVLSCQHSYCRKCLERLVTGLGREDYEVTCPECRKSTKVSLKAGFVVVQFRIRGSGSRKF